jgi:hypothetical protein
MTALAYLQRGKKALLLGESVMSTPNMLECARTLNVVANNRARDFYKAQSLHESGAYWRFVYETSVQTLKSIHNGADGEENAETAPVVLYLESMVMRTSENSGILARKVGDWHVSPAVSSHRRDVTSRRTTLIHKRA